MESAGEPRDGPDLAESPRSPDPLGNGQSPFGAWYGARPWPHGDHMQRDQRTAVIVVGLIVGALILAILAWAVIAG